MNYELLYQGSVKNLYQGSDHVLFEYSDRYSLFDWGEMPDQLDKKGESLALMGALFFKEVEKAKIPHHFLGLSDEKGNDLDWEPSRYLKVKKVPVTRPNLVNGQYDYSFYQTNPQEGLVPLEVMFRFGVGKGSSLTKRVQNDPTLLKQWNLTSLNEGSLWDLPLIDFSTKLEKGDRYLTHAEAQKLAGLSDVEFNTLTEKTTQVALVLKDLCYRLGIELWDGKLEWCFTPGTPRSFMLVDSIGLDELRLEKEGVSLSKEFLREYYRTTSWYQDLNEAKKRAETIKDDFKTLCKSTPAPLNPKIKTSAENMYLAFTNDLAREVIGKPVFSPELTLKTWRIEK